MSTKKQTPLTDAQLIAHLEKASKVVTAKEAAGEDLKPAEIYQLFRPILISIKGVIGLMGLLSKKQKGMKCIDIANKFIVIFDAYFSDTQAE